MVTPLQMALGYAAIANNGKLWEPYVVKRIEGGSSNEIDEIKPSLKRKISHRTVLVRSCEEGFVGCC